ncbi:MAG: hypothetical protein RL213_595 [Bacteroidota bacterium]|jgi:uncharacterized repeat protein (TIGR01451 family)
MRNALLTLTAFHLILQSTLFAATCGTVVNVTGNCLCFGDSSGSAVLTPNNSLDPYWLTLNGATSQFYTIDSLLGLTAGSYSFLVMDSISGCSDTGTFIITGPSAPLTATATTSTVCAGTFGWAAVTASGGTPPYIYLWNNGSTSPVQQGLPPGIYFITVMDANGCTATTTASITPLPTMTLSFSVVPASCNNCNDGIITANVIGGAPPYSYSWNSAAASGSVFAGAGPGLYNCCVTDANGCVVCDSVACLGPGFQTLTGSVFYDYNGNGTRDSGEAGAANQHILLMPDSLTALSSMPFGEYRFYLTNGSYTDSLVVPAGWHTTTPSAYPLNLTGAGANGLDFGLYPDQPNAGFGAGFLYSQAPRCLSQRAYYLRIQNTGWSSASGVAALTIDPQMTSVSASPPADSVVGTTYYWHFDSISTGQSTYRYLYALLPAAGSVLQLHQNVWTYDSSGVLLPTDSSSLTQTVLCSYDPNDKSVNPSGFVDAAFGVFIPGSVEMNTPLEYTIRFQNTGNDTAYTVVIRDTIDQEMDVSTLELEGASHPFTAGLDRHRVLTFTFNNILLPDSNTDEPGSHGFVQFRIRPNSNMPWTTYVNNTAFIYFDANAPVVTNTTSTLYDAIAAVEDPPYSVPAYNDFLVMPNPADGMFLVTFKDTQNGIHRVSVVNLLGATVRDLGKVIGSSVPVSRDGLPAGIYFVRVDDAARKVILN